MTNANDIKSPGDVNWEEVEPHKISSLCGDDAAMWASVLCYYVRKVDGHDLNEDWIHSWLCYLIEGVEIARERRRQPETLPALDYLRLVKPDHDEA